MPLVLFVVLLVFVGLALPPVGLFPHTYAPAGALAVLAGVWLVLLLLGRL